MTDYNPYDPLSYQHLAESVVRALLERQASSLPPLDEFPGAGVYALYYTGNFEAYEMISSPDCHVPIYVGKAIFAGGRTGRTVEDTSAKPLYIRLKQHSRSIESARNLDLSDFRCRYLTVRDVWIKLAEESLISEFKPVWNIVLDGFGNHDPGKGRRNMIRPKWDTLHPGRAWADGLRQEHSADAIMAEVIAHLEKTT